MFEVTGNEISELNDDDLRSLVGLLCEADLREQNLPTAGVTWGGNQNAKDGGVDVRVRVSINLNPDEFIPRAESCFQVKRTSMPPSKILKEMCPDDVLRPAIKDLINKSGAYIIVSSIDSTADTALTERREAMKEAIAPHDNALRLALDFYDRDRIAAWVRCHPSLILWVRQKIGKSIHGWRPFENWAEAPGGLEEEYLLDNEVRLFDDENPKCDGMMIVDGINQLREKLRNPSTSIRLVGL